MSCKKILFFEIKKFRMPHHLGLYFLNTKSKFLKIRN